MKFTDLFRPVSLLAAAALITSCGKESAPNMSYSEANLALPFKYLNPRIKARLFGNYGETETIAVARDLMSPEQISEGKKAATLTIKLRNGDAGQAIQTEAKYLDVFNSVAGTKSAAAEAKDGILRFTCPEADFSKFRDQLTPSLGQDR